MSSALPPAVLKLKAVVRLGRADHVALGVSDVYFRDVHFARQRPKRLYVVGMPVLQRLADRHALPHKPLVDAVDYLGFDVLERAVDERVGVLFGKAVVYKPCEGHRKHEGGENAQRELQVQTAPRRHFAPPSAMTALAAARTSGRRLSTATP